MRGDGRPRGAGVGLLAQPSARVLARRGIMTAEESPSGRQEACVSVGGDPSEPRSLGDLFARQDGVANRNIAVAVVEFRLIERGLLLGLSFTYWLNEDPILAERKAKPPHDGKRETIGINLLHAAWSILMNATRLTMYGAHVDALGLIRSALEATCHAEYFRDHPAEVAEWSRMGRMTDLDERAAAYIAFQRSKRVLQSVEAKYAPDRSLSRLFRTLSTFGPHPNPMTVGLRLSSDVPGRANLGFISVGKPQATRLCAVYVMDGVAYMLSEFRDGSPDYLARNANLVQSLDGFERDYAAYRACAPRELSLLE